MPCEGCHMQFTVFKRKRSCNDCKRYYCYNCLVNFNNNNCKHVLCERCLLFSKRPLVRSDLIKLKPKDLIFYLQSKHISTAGCVEKEELIDLVLQYVNRTDMKNQANSCGSDSSSANSSQHTTPQHNNKETSVGEGIGAGDGARRSTDYGSSVNNSFDSIKQTCQNFFSNLGDNISDSLANLETRACSKNRPSAATTKSANVTEQPRVSTRVIPTYASSQQNSPENPITSPIIAQRSSDNAGFIAESLVVDLPPSLEQIQDINGISNSKEECSCSDDEEMIASFNGRTRSPKSEGDSQNLSVNRDEHDFISGTNTNRDINTFNNCAPSHSTSTSKTLTKLDIYVNDEESSHSSFEELGAIGGISDDSKTTTDTTSNTTDNWQMLDLKFNEGENAQHHQPQDEQDIEKSVPMIRDALAQNHKSERCIESQEHVNHPPPTPTHAHPTPRVKKVIRRRSESYLNRRRAENSIDDEDENVNHILKNPGIEEECQTSSTRKTATKRCCTRCGKNKANIRQQVEKMRQHLESSQMSETDIKQELSEFLAYLEQRTKSIEYSDSEAGVSTASASRHTNETEEKEVSVEQQLDEQISREQVVNLCSASYNANDDQSDGTFLHFLDKNSRFINLDEIGSIKQLEALTVKQLKEILMLHRVDYKGCCEKQELFDRVERLWKTLKSTPAVEKLPTDELCKICMDAPIECVILECGHMATCTNCGKVLSECPICRQYIVRVVRLFRA